MSTKFIVIEVGPSAANAPVPHGDMAFALPPSVGNLISMSDGSGTGQAYEVVARFIANDAAPTAGDLYIRHVGTDTDVRVRIRQDASQK